MRTRALVPVVALTLAAAAACGGKDKDGDGYFSMLKPDTAPLVLGPGDVKISNQDSSLDLAVAGDNVVMQFGARTRDKLARDLDTTRTNSSGKFGSMIEKTVKGAVSDMLNRRLVYPVDEIASVAYRDGRIEIEGKERHKFSFQNVKTDGTDTSLDSFAPDEARKFVMALEARMAEVARR